MKSVITSLLLATTLVASAEFEVTQENLREGRLVKGSESSQNVGLYCIHRGVTTATVMALMDRSRSKILAEIPIRSTYATPRPAEEWLEVLWNSEGTAVVIHDSLDKDSKVLIYRLSDGGEFTLIPLPDLRAQNARRVGISVDSIRSSGQEPIKWAKSRMVMIEFRYATNNGKRYRHQYGVAFDEKWRHIQQ
jgi:hypothetical protein